MDASSEFRFINTTQSCSGSTSSSTRRAKRSGNSSAHSTASSTNSLRTVPVCMYNENRSFKLRFFWDKAFKLFNSHRPVYRVESGVNYQDFGTIGSCNNATLDNPTTGNGILVGGGSGSVKVRSQSHNQLNKLGGSRNETDLFRSHNRRAVPTSSATTSRLLTTVTSGSSSEARNSKMNGRQLYHERSNVNDVGGGGARNGGSSSAQQQHIEEQNFIPVVPARIRISGGEKPRHDDDGRSDKHSFYYDDISGMYANAHSYQRCKKSSILNNHARGATITTGTSSNNIFYHSTANNPVSATVAPDQLRRSHSVKSHYSKSHSSPTGSAYQSWNSSSAGSSKQRFYPEGDSVGGGSGSTSYNTVSSPCPCHNSVQGGGGPCHYSNCEGSCQEEEEPGEVLDDSDTIGNDSGLDTWKKNSSTAANDSPRSSGSGEAILKNSGGVGKTKPGIVCTISQRIPSYPQNYQRQQYIEDDDDENDYATVASESEEENEESEVEHSYNGMNRCGPSDNSDFVDAEVLDENQDKGMMIDNGNVMYDSLDETYSVPPVSGNTTVVLINGCCQSDHCQNAPLSDTFNFSDYDVECMSEIDLNSEPGSGTGSNEEAHHHHQHNPTGQKGSSAIAVSGDTGNEMKFDICHSPSENELDSLDLAMFETNRAANTLSSTNPAGESCKILFTTKASMLAGNNNSHNPEQCIHKGKVDQSSSLFGETAVTCNTIGAAGEREGDGCSQLLLVSPNYGTHNSMASTTTTSSVSIKSTMTTGNNQNEEMYSNSNWSDAGSEFEFLGPVTGVAPANGLNRDIPMGHSPRGNPPEVEWEPYFCVLNQLDQTFTSYRSEEMSKQSKDFKMEINSQDNTCFSFAELEQADPRFINAKSMMEEMHRLKGAVRELMTRQTNFIREFQAERVLNAEWREEMKEMICKIAPQQVEGEDSNCSQSLLARPLNQSVAIDPPFVSIRYPDGTMEDVVIPREVQRTILAEKTYRPVIRKILLFLHDDDKAYLRTCTLTGESRGVKRSLEEESGHDGASSPVLMKKTALPMRSLMIAQAVIFKLFPTKFTLDPEERFQAEKEREKNFREGITKALNYFAQSFDANGNKIQKVSKEK